MIGQTISHYKIIEKLGEGGMGIVYKAQDTKLDRIVALKFLPRHLDHDETEQARFLQEAKTASSLNHPNVCVIHDIGESGDQQFIVMEYIEGETLRGKIAMAGKNHLPLTDVLSYAVQIAEAMQEAHRKGIVHRDIKSENIMVNSNNQIKVMDFGLAKLKGSMKLTKTSSTVGTIGYMSPEQIQGTEADVRSDIFSFGVVIYEMLTGKMPFRGEHEAAMMYSIVNDSPEPPEKYRPAIPVELLHVLHRAMEREPGDRYQSVDDILIDLRRLRKSDLHEMHAPAPLMRATRAKLFISLVMILVVLILAGIYFFRQTVKPPVEAVANSEGAQVQKEFRYKLAILPFQNIGDDEKMNFLGYALADNIITNLSYIQSIIVRPSSAISRYRGTVADNQQIAKELDANILLTGNYIREGDDLHLTTQLVDVGKNSMIWQQPFDLKYKSIISLQKEITSEIIKGLQLTLTATEQLKVASQAPKDPLAYEFYLRGKAYSATSDIQSLQRAIASFDQAISLEPSFAPAHADKGFASIYLGIWSGNAQLFARAEDALRRALAIDSTLPGALSTLGFYYIQTGQKERALPLLQKAEQIAPNISDIHNNICYFYRISGLLEEAYDEVNLALQLNPNDRRAYSYKAITLQYMRRYAESISAGQDGLKKYPDDTQLLVLVAQTYAMMDRFDDVYELGTKMRKLDPDNTISAFGLGIYYSHKNEPKEALEIIRKIEEHSRVDMEQPVYVAICYGYLGMTAEAVKWMRVAMNNGFDAYPWFETIKSFDSMRSDPEFRKLSEEMKKRFESLKMKYGRKGSS